MWAGPSAQPSTRNPSSCSSRSAASRPARPASSSSSSAATAPTSCPTDSSPSLADARVYLDASEQIVIATDCGMKYLPHEAARGKMAAMAGAARILRAEVG